MQSMWDALPEDKKIAPKRDWDKDKADSPKADSPKAEAKEPASMDEPMADSPADDGADLFGGDAEKEKVASDSDSSADLF
jgi:hypothetical protein